MLKRLIPTATLAAAVLAPSAAQAAPTVAREFDLGETPGRVTTDPAGNAWVILTSGTREIAKVTPAGVVTTYDAPAFRSPLDITLGPDGNLWLSQSDSVARFTTADPTRAVSFPVAGLGNAQGIATGPDQNVWTASDDQVVQIDPATGGVIRRFTVAGMNSRGIATAGGNLWIADFGGDRVVELTTAGAATFYPTGTDSDPQEVAGGLGGQVAYTAAGLNPDEVGLITPPGPPLGVPTPNTDAFGVAFGLDEAYWVANFLSDDLSRLTSAGQVTTLPGFTDNSGPRHVAASLTGTLWVGLELSKRLALVTGIEAPPQPPVNPPVDPPVTPPANPNQPPTNPQPPNNQPQPPGNGPRFIRVSLTRAIVAGRAATLRLTVTEARSVAVTVQRKASGRKARGGRCAAPSRANRRAKRCTRWVPRGRAITAPVTNGAVTVTLGRRLAAGSYRVTVSASNAAGSATVSRSLTVRPKPRRSRRR